MRLALLLLLALVSCQAYARDGDIVFVGARVVGTGDASLEGTLADLRVRRGRIVAIGPKIGRADADVVDVAGKWLAPAFIDSHVHIVYEDFSDELPRGGIAGVVDLAAPSDQFFGADFGALRVVGSGPMITAVNGYPTTSWGSDGYGIEVATRAEASRAVELLAKRGARVIKIPFGAGPDLSDPIALAAIATAHHLNLPVAAHATSDAAAARAARLGADILAHVPTVAMSDATIAAWADCSGRSPGGSRHSCDLAPLRFARRSLIPTLTAFGGSAAAVENVRRLRAVGVRVLYGTDLGNTQTPRIARAELELMRAAGMDGQAILEAGTSAPASFWGFAELGTLAPGRAASMLVLDVDPRVDPTTLASPSAVWIDGARATP